MKTDIAEASGLPLEIQVGFFGEEAEVSSKRLGGGMINATYLAESRDGRKAIVQKVNSIFEPITIAADFSRVSVHMRSHGWEAPTLLQNGDGFIYERDRENEPWRALSYIDSDAEANTNSDDTATMKKCGSLLARWHVDMQTLTYQPEHKLPHFHDTPYYMEKLMSLVDMMPDEDSHVFAQEVIAGYQNLPELPDYGKQILHGDPRTDNMLFRNGEPITLIDYDTIMHGQIWIDVGDMLRSLAENALKAGKEVPLGTLAAVAESYREIAYPEVDAAVFEGHALNSMKIITCELTARYLNDIAENHATGDYYFQHNPEIYPDNAAHTRALARIQWEIFNSVDSEES